jgi:hypothetical protein
MLQELEYTRIIPSVEESSGRRDEVPGILADTTAAPAAVAARSWAFAVNRTVDSSNIEITLFSFVVVGDLARVTGLIHVRNRPDVRLASVPDLSLTTADGSSLEGLSGHVLPHGAMAWVSWLFRRPANVLTDYEGRIDRVDLDHHTGGRVPRPRQPQHGTWVFRFTLPPTPAAANMAAALAD